MKIILYIFAAILVVSTVIGWYYSYKVYSTIVKKKYKQFPFATTYIILSLKSIYRDLTDIVKEEGVDLADLEKYALIFKIIRRVNFILISLLVLFAVIVIKFNK